MTILDMFNWVADHHIAWWVGGVAKPLTHDALELGYTQPRNIGNATT